MKRSILLFLWLAMLVCCDDSYGIAVRHDNTRSVTMSDPKWGEVPSQQLTNLANRPERVGGYWCNSNDYVYFAGDTNQLNDFLSQYAKLTETPYLLVIHAGKAPPQEMVEKKDAKSYDWRLDSLHRLTREKEWFKKLGGGKWHRIVVIHTWVGDKIRLDKIQLPANIKVRSGGEIERFIEEQNKKKAEGLPELPRLMPGLGLDAEFE